MGFDTRPFTFHVTNLFDWLYKIWNKDAIVYLNLGGNGPVVQYSVKESMIWIYCTVTTGQANIEDHSRYIIIQRNETYKQVIRK